MKQSTKESNRAIVGVVAAAMGLASGAALAQRPEVKGEGPTVVERGLANSDQLGLETEFEGSNDNTSTFAELDFSTRLVLMSKASLTPGDVDYFKMTLQAGDRIAVVTSPLGTLPGFSSPDTVVTIRNSLNGILVEGDDAGADFPAGFTVGSVVRFVAPSTGTYFVRVNGFNNSAQGEYLLTAARINDRHWFESGNNNPLSAPPLALSAIGPSVGAAFAEAAGTLDHYPFDARGGDIVTATLAPTSGLPSGWTSPDLKLELLDRDAVTVLRASLDDGAGEFPNNGAAVGCTLRIRIPQAGRYYLRVTDESMNFDGTYRLVTSRLPAAICAGDADGNTTVNFADLTNVLLNFNNVCN